jgi:hypothetical protein
MMLIRWGICILLLSSFVGTCFGAAGAEQLLQNYQKQGAGPFSRQAGKKLWLSVHAAKDNGSERSCSDCHGSDLKQSGKHVRTGKPIKPMSPAVNAERLTDQKKMEKWFKRNCKWTFGRECTPQEKGDVILFIQDQN